MVTIGDHPLAPKPTPLPPFRQQKLFEDAVEQVRVFSRDRRKFWQRSVSNGLRLRPSADKARRYSGKREAMTTPSQGRCRRSASQRAFEAQRAGTGRPLPPTVTYRSATPGVRQNGALKV